MLPEMSAGEWVNGNDTHGRKDNSLLLGRGSHEKSKGSEGEVRLALFARNRELRNHRNIGSRTESAIRNWAAKMISYEFWASARASIRSYRRAETRTLEGEWMASSGEEVS